PPPSLRSDWSGLSGLSGRHFPDWVDETYRNRWTTSPEYALDKLWAFKNPYARVERIQAHSGTLNIILSVEGRYSVKLIRRGEADPSDRPEQYQILFLPK
ncbi:MAG: hypothetical protein ACM3X4_00140, partial [Ignavibacteriales bacterium]